MDIEEVALFKGRHIHILYQLAVRLFENPGFGLEQGGRIIQRLEDALVESTVISGDKPVGFNGLIFIESLLDFRKLAGSQCFGQLRHHEHEVPGDGQVVVEVSAWPKRRVLAKVVDTKI